MKYCTAFVEGSKKLKWLTVMKILRNGRGADKNILPWFFMILVDNVILHLNRNFTFKYWI